MPDIICPSSTLSQRVRQTHSFRQLSQAGPPPAGSPAAGLTRSQSMSAMFHRPTHAGMTLHGTLLEPKMREQEGQMLDLDTNCGNKAGIAQQVAKSPKKLAVAFRSKQPQRQPHRKSAWKGEESPDQPVPSSFMTREPWRSQSSYRSKRDRFDFTRAGAHPNLSPPIPSFTPGKELERDRQEWERPTFYASNAPRHMAHRRPLTSDIDTALGSVTHGLADRMRLSPQHISPMTSKRSRFVPVEAGKAAPQLGPGSYDTPAAGSHPEMGAGPGTGTGRPTPTVISSSPRFHKLRDGNGGSTTDLRQDSKRTWDRPLMAHTAHGPSGRVVAGPQTGSYEGRAGIGRAASPERRSPDLIYRVEVSPQKLSLVGEMEASPVAYSASFRSTAERLPSPDALDATGRPRLSESRRGPSPEATMKWSADAAEATLRMSPPRPTTYGYASTSPRFPASRTASESITTAADKMDTRHWTEGIVRVTDSRPAEQFGSFATSPGPGTYLTQAQWSPTTSPATQRAGGRQRSTTQDSLW